MVIFSYMEEFKIKSPILPIILGSNEKADAFSKYLLDNNFVAYPIKYPTVKKDTARVRIVLNASLSIEDIQRLKEVINNYGIIL